MEIERKWRITDKSLLPTLDKGIKIEQGYLAIESGEFGAEIRLDDIRDGSGKGKHYLVRKKGDDIKHRKHVTPIPYPVFRDLWPSTGQKKICKTRYEIKLPPQTVLNDDREIETRVFIAQIDVYKGKLEGLIIVEVEFDTRLDAHYFRPPTWFGEELSHDKRYREKNLVRYGIPEEKPAEDK